MVFHWSLSDSKSPQVSKILVSILVILNDVVAWMISTRHHISKSSSPFINPLVIVPRAQITIGIIVTFIFHSVFNSLARSRYLSFFYFLSFFILWTDGIAKSKILQVLFFLFWINIRSYPHYFEHVILFNEREQNILFSRADFDTRSCILPGHSSVWGCHLLLILFFIYLFINLK